MISSPNLIVNNKRHGSWCYMAVNIKLMINVQLYGQFEHDVRVGYWTTRRSIHGRLITKQFYIK